MHIKYLASDVFVTILRRFGTGGPRPK